MKAKLFICFLCFLVLLFAILGEPAIAQMDIITGAVVASTMFSDESSMVGIYMKVYVDIELGKKINNLEIRRVKCKWGKHDSIQEAFQWAVGDQKFIYQLVAVVHNLDDNSLMFYYMRVE